MFISGVDDNNDMSRKIPEYGKRKVDGIPIHRLWDLRSTISKWLLPKLKAFRKVTDGCPGSLTQEEWYKILDEMIASLELIRKDDKGDILTKEEWKTVDRGWRLFHKWYWSLWY